MTYFTSDLHFGHENILRYDKRPFSSIKEHDEELIKRWNAKVKPGDTVYILGDFSWLNARETEELIKRLNGTKFLIKGNHDRWCKDAACKKLFQGIYDYKTITDGDKSVVMSHYPILFYQNQHRNSVLLYGHVHNTREEKLFQDACKHIASTTDIPMNCYNVGCMLDYMNYYPRTLKEILEGSVAYG